MHSKSWNSIQNNKTLKSFPSYFFLPSSLSIFKPIVAYHCIYIVHSVHYLISHCCFEYPCLYIKIIIGQRSHALLLCIQPLTYHVSSNLCMDLIPSPILKVSKFLLLFCVGNYTYTNHSYG